MTRNENNINTNEFDLRVIGRKLNQLISLKVHEIKGEKSQNEMIILLNGLGFSPTEIATLLGTTTNSVNPVLSRSRKKKGKT